MKRSYGTGQGVGYSVCCHFHTRQGGNIESAAVPSFNMSPFHICTFSLTFFFFFFLYRETNLKFKMGLRVTDERLQHERQLAEFDGECGCAENRHPIIKN